MFTPFPCDRQLDTMDCGPACLKTIAKHYGKYYSLQYLRDKCGLTRHGASFIDLGCAAESIGLRSL
uniref:cysteine peptidase family C39 domain-containing protein n=1 Tax=uncultured Chitinophaga sp. TaxID=339340 RepID=UPI0025DEC6F3